MNRLEELIKTLCPDGVIYKPLGDVVNFINGRAYKQSELLDEGKYKVLRVGNFYTNDKWYYSNLELDEDKYCNRGDLLYTWAATIGPQIWNGEKAIYHYHIWKLEFDETLFDKMFLYYFLCKDVDDIFNSLTNSTMPHVSMSSMKKRMIPIPPMEVQCEIVRILSNFTELTEELTEELTARKQQYEYYRNELLKPVNLKKHSEKRIRTLCPDGIEYKSLGDLCDISTGKLNANAKNEDGIYPFFTCDAKPYKINNYAFDTTAIIISGNGSQVGHINFYSGKFNAYQRTYVLDNFKNIEVKYLLHYLTAYLKPYIIKNSKKGSVPYITLPMLDKFDIPVPPLEVQREIVSILDNFTELTEELTTELTARKQQYEYYRDKLLAFKEKTA